MTAKEIITSIIEKDEILSSIRLNTKTNKIEIENDIILSCDYERTKRLLTLWLCFLSIPLYI